MDKALLFFGAFIIILGIVIFYLVFISIINLGQAIKGQATGLPQLKKNEIYVFTPISLVIVVIGVLILREAFKR